MVGAVDLRNEALKLDAMGSVVYPGPARLDRLARRDHRGMTDDGNEIALASRLNPKDAEAVLELWKVTRSTNPARISCELAVEVRPIPG